MKSVLPANSFRKLLVNNKRPSKPPLPEWIGVMWIWMWMWMCLWSGVIALFSAPCTWRY